MKKALDQGKRGREMNRRTPFDVEDDDLARLVPGVEDEMHVEAKESRFEYAVRLGDEVNELKREQREVAETD